MLTNTKKSFWESFILCIALMIIFTSLIVWFMDVYSEPGKYNIIQDFIVILVASFFIFFPSIWFIRYAYVMRAYSLLYFPYLYLVPFLLITGADTFQMFKTNSQSLLNIIAPFAVIVVIFVGYTLFIYIERKKGLFNKMAPTERIQLVYRALTRKQKFTLVFPDRYIKFLETGDEKYLKG